MAQWILTYSTFGWQRLLCGFLLAGSLLAAKCSAVCGQQLSSGRSLTDVRQRIPDEHNRPYFRETQSHRGWEIREPQFTIVADTSADDARWAAQHVAEAWKNASSLTDRWTTVHHNPDFALNALQVTISNEPLRDRDAPLTSVNVVGIQTQIQINVAPGQPSLPLQVARLREGAAFGMLHASGFDNAAPPWAVAGLAAAAGRTGLTEEQIKANAIVGQAARFGGQQWRYPRESQDTLAVPNTDHEEAAARMAFLLKGNDAAYSPALFASLRQTTATATQTAAIGQGFNRLPGDPQPAETGTTLDQLAASLDEQYLSWKANPLAGEPVFVPTANAPAELEAIEREMVVLLKISRRLGVDEFATTVKQGAGAKVATVDRGFTRTKIITFDRTKGAATAQPIKPATPAAKPLSFAVFADKLLNSGEQVWGTVDADGRILLSSDVARVQQLLGPPETYVFERNAERTALTRRLENGRSLRGWLEENPQDQSRPLAKFELVGMANGKPKVITAPQVGRQVFNTLPTR